MQGDHPPTGLRSQLRSAGPVDIPIAANRICPRPDTQSFSSI
jgi:hypothetical protein